jgi:hypothetical protein
MKQQQSQKKEYLNRDNSKHIPLSKTTTTFSFKDKPLQKTAGNRLIAFMYVFR